MAMVTVNGPRTCAVERLGERVPTKNPILDADRAAETEIIWKYANLINDFWNPMVQYKGIVSNSVAVMVTGMI